MQVMWKLAQTEFQSLDQTEDPRAYRRERLQVHSQDGQPYDCHAYLAIPDQPDVPYCNYLDALIQAGRDVSLPPRVPGPPARPPPALAAHPAPGRPARSPPGSITQPS